MRHITPELLPYLNDYRPTQLSATLSHVVDLATAVANTPLEDQLIDDLDMRYSQQTGRTAFESGCEGMLVPSATRLGINLVIFPENLRKPSQIEIVDSRDPRLRIEP